MTHGGFCWRWFVKRAQNTKSYLLELHAQMHGVYDSGVQTQQWVPWQIKISSRFFCFGSLK